MRDFEAFCVSIGVVNILYALIGVHPSVIAGILLVIVGVVLGNSVKIGDDDL